MVIIDGNEQPDTMVDPVKHRFIGSFRYPFSFPPFVDTKQYPWVKENKYSGNYIIICPCGEDISNQKIALEHWSKGHWDIPQYLTIENWNDPP